ncbi:DUF3037 domain-containing protein [Flavobacterium psychrotolerans]|uniref:DUF3037 domain-containing protein n=1 Tax=Flavobacterium psychrotolerans TaxID=2169410 RepID=A0A2U1JIY3_9FLAO|nr:DUF3037 domain-containing protein [Flavobacterium psychrotolerans]PWA05097.1 hypothetical protein DB895_08715 [Flavobacterium psychrotolerans]
MENNQYIYSILKYKHSLLLGESLNIGILIYIPNEEKFIFRYSKSLSRIKSIYDIVSEKTIKQYLSQIELKLQTLKSDEIHFYQNELVNFFDKFIDKFILPQDGSVLQFSSSKTSYSYGNDSETIANNLTSKYLLDKEKHIAGITTTKEPILVKKFYGYLSSLDFERINQNANKFYKNYKVRNETGNEFNFDYAWQNGTLNLIKPISFDLKESKGIAEKAYKNFGLFTDLSNEASSNNLRYDLLIARPTLKSLYREFDHALGLLETLQRVEIVLEENIEKYSQKAINALTLDI